MQLLAALDVADAALPEVKNLQLPVRILHLPLAFEEQWTRAYIQRCAVQKTRPSRLRRVPARKIVFALGLDCMKLNLTFSVLPGIHARTRSKSSLYPHLLLCSNGWTTEITRCDIPY